MATLGFASIGVTSGGFANAQIEVAGPWTMSEDGTATDIGLYGQATSSAPVTYGIYADAAGVPGSLLATSAEVTLINTFQWWPASISYALLNGVTYWLAYRAGGAGTIFHDATTPSGKFNTSSTYVSGVMPSSLPSMTNFTNIKRSLRVNYTPGGGGGGSVLLPQQQDIYMPPMSVAVSRASSF